MKRERVICQLAEAAYGPAGLRDFFAAVFADLDARPRALAVEVAVPRAAPTSIDLEQGEPVFSVGGAGRLRAAFRGRWIAEHPVPLVVRGRRLRLRLRATTGNRVAVSEPGLFR